jgi:predicted nucleic acid-binding Zn ribbon protein
MLTQDCSAVTQEDDTKNVRKNEVMFCSKCGKQIPHDSTFCSACGKAVQDRPAQARLRLPFIFLIAGVVLAIAFAVVQVNRHGNTAETVPAESKAETMPTAAPSPDHLDVAGQAASDLVQTLSNQAVASSQAAVRATMNALPIPYADPVVTNPPSELPAAQPLPIPPAPVLRTTHSLPLYAGFTSVPAKQLTWKCFSIAASQEDPKVIGRFQAAGGSGNDIQMVVASEDEFTSWRTIHSGTLLYDSGKMTATGVEVPMPGQGRYCAGFSNAFSGFSAKSVNATINLDFSTWETAN